MRKPSVLEEVQTGLDYFRLSLFDAVCTTYRYAENSLQVISQSMLLSLLLVAFTRSPTASSGP